MRHLHFFTPTTLALLLIHDVLQLLGTTSDAHFVDSTLKGCKHLFQTRG